MHRNRALSGKDEFKGLLSQIHSLPFYLCLLQRTQILQKNIAVLLVFLLVYSFVLASQIPMSISDSDVGRTILQWEEIIHIIVLKH